MDSVSKKCLFQSNNYAEESKGLLKKLFLSEEFSDVTLVSDDGQSLPAHRNILSAGSDFFRTILLKNPHPNSLILMDSANQNTLHSVLQFMYTGQVEIQENDLQEFLRVGTKFKLDGLSNDDNEKMTENVEKEKVKEDNEKLTENVEKEKVKQEIIDEDYTRMENNFHESRKETNMVKKPPLEMNKDEAVDDKNATVDLATEANKEDTLDDAAKAKKDETVNSNVEKKEKAKAKKEETVDSNVDYREKNSKREDKLRKSSSYGEWYESVHKRYRHNYSCDQCIFVADSRSSLKSHIKDVHDNPNNPCKCNLCGEKFSHNSSLAHHKRNIHEKKAYRQRR